jgi:hypothetical protein
MAVSLKASASQPFALNTMSASLNAFATGTSATTVYAFNCVQVGDDRFVAVMAYA